MRMLPTLRLIPLLVGITCAASAFVGPSSSFHHQNRRSSTTSLSVVAPPMIIGPMLRKMKEEQEAKKKPMADANELATEAPGLRVGKKIWKWPPIWPYDSSIFKASGEADALKKQQSMQTLTNMLSGQAQLPTEEDVTKAEALKFNAIKYWNEEAINVTSALDDEAADKLRTHFQFYLQNGMSVLEFGPGEDSYLPKELKLKRHVGVGVSQKDMAKNPSLTETLVVDLNDVVPDRDVNSDDLRRLAQEPFDAIITTNTVGYLVNPREVFRSAWYLLKPGGLMIVAFSGTEATKDEFADAQTKIWRQYNNDQHMWITGSFFHFSAGDGWESLLGFDISPASSKQPDAGPLDRILGVGKPNNIFVVQARKGAQDDSINLENLEKSINSLCWMLPTLESRDKRLVVPRLTRVLETGQRDDLKETIERNIQHLPAIYECLVKMDQFAFTFSYQSQIACDLICDPDFSASEEQMLSLKEGLGLRAPSEEFWKPVGQYTAVMEVEDKISLLAYLVPRFGSNDPAQEEALQAFVTGLKPTYAVIRSKCPDLTESEVELIGTELLACEIAKPGWTTREEFAAWVGMLSGEEIRELVQVRKSYRQQAGQDLVAYKEAREAEKKRIDELRKKMQEQIETARKERSLYFNPKTEKIEVFKRK